MKSVCLYAVGILLLSACAREPAETSAPTEPVHSHLYRDGPITVALSVSETNILTSGRIQLILDVQAPIGTDVTFPEIELPSGPFLIADTYADPAQTLANGKQMQRRTWILVPARSGGSVLQPLRILAGSFAVDTAPVALRVTSILPPDLDSLTIRDIAAPVPLLPVQRRIRQYGLIAGGAIFMPILLLLLIHRLRRPKPVPIPSPQETALRAMETLPDEPVACVHELNRILKNYLEAHHHFPATGKTATELVPLLEAPCFAEVAGFLSSAEQMRFANQVTPSFAEEATQLLRSFIKGEEQEVSCG